MNEIIFPGCCPQPLAHYLKALGMFRLIVEQLDPQAQACWRHDSLVLYSTRTQTEIEHFFLHQYQPTPVLSPWNGGSGFFPKDAKEALLALEHSSSERFAVYRQTIAMARQQLETLSIRDKLSEKEKDRKQQLLAACRNSFPEEALRWVDAAVLLTNDGSSKFPPLLGTGGNDGRFEFSQNYMQRIVSLFSMQTGNPEPTTAALLSAALYGHAFDGLQTDGIGQFFPSASGGPNHTTGYEANSLMNPWDLVLMLEGSSFFIAAASRKMLHDAPGALSYPFTVKVSSIGYSGAADSDELSARAEMWMPLWEQPVSLPELSALFAEGRAQVGQRMARHGLDFARAVASLGVDRGLSSFVRYGFLNRNGKAFFAVPLGRFVVSRQPQVELLAEIDGWLETLRSKASNKNAPASVQRRFRQLEEAIFALCQARSPQRVQAVLIALGQCQHALGHSLEWCKESYIRPVPSLSLAWLQEANDESVALRLAASLASSQSRLRRNPSGTNTTSSENEPIEHNHIHHRFRPYLDPIRYSLSSRFWNPEWRDSIDRDCIHHNGEIHTILSSVMQRQLLHSPCYVNPEQYQQTAYFTEPTDLCDFIEGRVDLQRLEDLLRGCMLLDWSNPKGVPFARISEADQAFPDSLYTLFKLCFAAHPLSLSVTSEQEGISIPLEPSIYRYLSSGQVDRACSMAIRRLRGSGLVARISSCSRKNGAYTQRLTASLLFPLHPRDLAKLARFVMIVPQTETDAFEKAI